MQTSKQAWMATAAAVADIPGCSLSHDMIPPIMTTTVTTRRQVARGWCFVSELVLLPKVLSATRENWELILGSTLTMVAARLSWVDANGSCSKQQNS